MRSLQRCLFAKFVGAVINDSSSKFVRGLAAVGDQKEQLSEWYMQFSLDIYF